MKVDKRFMRVLTPKNIRVFGAICGFVALIAPTNLIAQYSEVHGTGNGPSQTSSNSVPQTHIVFPWEKSANDLLDSTMARFKCTNLPKDPGKRARVLLTIFNLPRQGEIAALQAMCRDEAKKTASELEKKDRSATLALRQASFENEYIMKTMHNLSACPGNPDSESRKRLLKYLSIAKPEPIMSHRSNVELPCTSNRKQDCVPQAKFYSELRQAVHIDALVKTEEQAFVMAKRYGMDTSNLVKRICPPQSSCADHSRQPDINSLLYQRYNELSKLNLPAVPRSQVIMTLNAAVKDQLNPAGKRLNSLLDHKVQAAPGAMPGSQFWAEPKSGKFQEAQQAVQSYYDTFDSILESQDGRLLEQQPFKAQLNGMFTFTGENLNEGKGPHDGWDGLPQNLRVTGKSNDVVEAANSVLDGMQKYTEELNSRDEAARKGNNHYKDKLADPFYVIGKDPNLVNLSVLETIAPAAFAQILADYPGIAEGGQLCAVLTQNDEMEGRKEIVKEARRILGYGSFAVGLTAMVIPGLQPVATGIIGAGIVISSQSSVNNYIAMQTVKSTFMASGDASYRRDAQKYSEEMVSSFTQVAGEAAGLAVMKVATAGLNAVRLRKLGEVMEEAKDLGAAKGALKINELGPEAEGNLLREFDKGDMAGLEGHAAKDPGGFEKLKAKLKKVFRCQ